MLGGDTGQRADGNTVIRRRRAADRKAVKREAKITERVEIKQCGI